MRGSMGRRLRDEAPAGRVLQEEALEEEALRERVPQAQTETAARALSLGCTGEGRLSRVGK